MPFIAKQRNIETFIYSTKCFNILNGETDEVKSGQQGYWCHERSSKQIYYFRQNLARLTYYIFFNKLFVVIEPLVVVEKVFWKEFD